ncbi:MAG: outer membrane protein assembly factor BamB, partial [Gammaproteobacteria bacterium]|nr:outer membrane protein assembly factor BamB [Gammaproteobacteria bacterium]
MILRYLCFPAVLTLLSGCSSINDKVTTFMGGEDNAEPPSPLVEIETRVEITKLWEKDMGKGSDEQYLKLVPVYVQEKIFVADNEGEIKAVNSLNGNIIWDQDTETRITGGPGAGDSLVMIGTSEGEILAISGDTGETLWRSRVSSEVLAAPQVAENIVVARTIDGKIYGLDAAEGKRLWTYDQSVPALTLRGTSAPVIAGKLVISGFDEGRLTAIELHTGKLVWETRIALGSGRSELERMVDIDADPLVIDDVIYVATFQGRIAAVTLDGGRILWTRDISSFAGLCADDRNIYITDDNSHVWALDRFTGNSIWKQEKLQARAVTAPASIGDLVVVGDLEGYLHWLDKATGEFVSRTQVSDTKIIASPIVVNDIVYSYTSDGTLGAYTYAGGTADIAIEAPSKEEEQKTEDTEIVVQQDMDEKNNKVEDGSGPLKRLLDFFRPDD